MGHAGSGRPNRRSIWLDGLTGNLRCPVAHAEGKLVTGDLPGDPVRNIAFRYVGPDGEIDPGYPANPNGSDGDAAGLVDDTGFVLGLMPHPEDHIHPRQDPLRGRLEAGTCCRCSGPVWPRLAAEATRTNRTAVLLKSRERPLFELAVTIMEAMVSQRPWRRSISTCPTTRRARFGRAGACRTTSA